jgi:hypothetical protein
MNGEYDQKVATASSNRTESNGHARYTSGDWPASHGFAGIVEEVDRNTPKKVRNSLIVPATNEGLTLARLAPGPTEIICLTRS